MAATIREYRPEDAAAIRDCIVELQDFERRIDERLRAGPSIAAESQRRAKAAGSPELRVAALSGNHSAIRLYERVGFVSYLTTLAKRT